MKRIHIALRVSDLPTSTDFYTALFGAAPTVRKDDYAKWLLDDPRVNFSITARAGAAHGAAGIEHLGIQAENEAELRDLYGSVAAAEAAAGAAVREEGHTTCCYAQSEKSWAEDPQGVEWEVFYTYGESESFHGTEESACCAADCCEEAEVR